MSVRVFVAGTATTVMGKFANDQDGFCPAVELVQDNGDIAKIYWPECGLFANERNALEISEQKLQMLQRVVDTSLPELGATEWGPQPLASIEPEWSPADILKMVTDGTFRQMADRDWDSFAGAQPGTLIAHRTLRDGSECTLLFGPEEHGADDSFVVHCYSYPADESGEERRWALRGHEWDAI